MELRTRAAVSTYIEVFVLIGVAMAGSALVYSATNSYSADLGGPGVTVSNLSIKQGQQIALLQMQIANTGTTTINSFTTTTSGISPSYPYLVYLNSGNSVTTGLVGYWPMNEGSGTTTADLSGNGNTGTLINSPTWQSGANCKFGSCLNWGASGYARTSSAINLGNTFTFALWYYPTSFASYYMPLAEGTGGCSTDNGVHLVISPSGSPYIETCNGLQSQSVASSTIPLNAWAFIVVTGKVENDNSITLQISINGGALAVNHGGAFSPLPNWNQIIGIGALSNGGFSGSAASEDDVRIYNRVLSASEVSAIYASSVGSVTQPTTIGPGQSVTVTIIIFSPNAFAIGGRYSVSVSASGAVEQVNGVAIPA